MEKKAPKIYKVKDVIENNKFKLKIHNIIEFENHHDVETITFNLNKVLEKMILKNPGQWIWTHDRWK